MNICWGSVPEKSQKNTEFATTYFDAIIQCKLVVNIKKWVDINEYKYLINNPRMFNGTIVDLPKKPYIQQKTLLQ